MNKNSGFTLIELLVTISLMTILMTMAVPSFSTMIKNGKLSDQSRALLTSFTVARSEAIKRHTAVRICSSSNGTSCLSTPDWTKGWVVLAGATVLQQHEAIPTGLTLCGQAGVLSGISYSSAGGTTGTGELRLCDDRGGSFSKSVEINGVGRASLDRSGNSCTCS